jgi:putative membrane protein
MEVIDAIKTSWKMTDGHALKVFGIGLLAIPIGIAGLLLFGIGIILSIMWINLAFASLYHSVSTSIGMAQQQKNDRYMELAKERYAKGEISKEELEQIKKDLT